MRRGERGGREPGVAVEGGHTALHRGPAGADGDGRGPWPVDRRSAARRSWGAIGRAAGAFRSGIEFASVFSPNPTEPVQVVRPAAVAATIGVVGDDRPGRWHAVFSPAPLCLVMGRERASGPTHIPGGDWLSLSVQAPVADLTFPELAYEPVDGGFWLRFDYDGHTRSTVASPPRRGAAPVPDPYAALDRTERPGRARLGGRRPAPRHGGGASRRSAAGAPSAPGHRCPATRRATRASSTSCRRPRPPAARRGGPGHPDDLRRAAGPARRARRAAGNGGHRRPLAAGLRPGRARPGALAGPAGLDRGPARGRHAGAAVVEGLGPRRRPGRGVRRGPVRPARWRSTPATPPTWPGCGDGRPAGRPGRAGRRRPQGRLHPTSPDGSGLRQHTGPDRTWGIAALHRLLQALYAGLKDAKPDALLITHTVHPGFGDVCDMVRLNDLSEQDPYGTPVSVVEQLRFRAAVARAALPHHLIDTDQWPMPDRGSWRAYVAAQNRLGVPALYYVERMDRSDERSPTTTWPPWPSSGTATAPACRPSRRMCWHRSGAHTFP